MRGSHSSRGARNGNAGSSHDLSHSNKARMLPRTLCPRALITLLRFKVIAGQLSDDRVQVLVGVRR